MTGSDKIELDLLIKHMEKTIAVLTMELSGLRVGRANPSILDSVVVEVDGYKTKINQIATVSVTNNTTLSVKPYNSRHCNSVEKSISVANLGFSCSSEGDIIVIRIPKISEETRKDLVRVAKKISEDSKIAVRNIRRDEMDKIKKSLKDKKISEDEQKKSSDLIQKSTDEFIKKIDLICEKKILEITTI